MPRDVHIEGYLSLPQAAKYAHISRQAVFLAIKNRGLLAVKIGRQWYVTKEDFDAYRTNKYNRDLRKNNGEFVFDMEKGHFSVQQVSKVISAVLPKPLSLQHLYYLIRVGRVKAFRKGVALVIPKEEAVALLQREKEKFLKETQRERLG